MCINYPFINQAQYAFIHDALDEFITCGETAISVTNIRITLAKLSKQEDTKTGFEEQYEVTRFSVFIYLCYTNYYADNNYTVTWECYR